MLNSDNSSLMNTITSNANNLTQLVEHPGIFLQSASAKFISGAFVWIAVCITLHHVSNSSYLDLIMIFSCLYISVDLHASEVLYNAF